MSDGATTAKGPLIIGLLKWLGVGLTVYGAVTIAGPHNTVEKITTVVRETGQQVTQVVQTGSVQQVNGFTVDFLDTIPLAQTGGVDSYDVARICPSAYGITGSGIVLGAGISMVRNPGGGKFTIAYSKAAKSSSSSLVLATANNMTVASGQTVLKGGVWSGSTTLAKNANYSQWNGADCVTVKSLTNPGNSSGYLILKGMDIPSK
ncbi:hypothetical protein KW797_00445 [Candidatus Parcubacteria bacterium]|nr:hypothetical protein [Candidatus Parcubacteria bacterium]